MTDFTSAIGMSGRKRRKSRKRTEKNPKVQKKVNMSTTVGEEKPQLEGRKSRDKVVLAMTNRSNNMPTLTKMAMIHTNGVFSRIFLNQKS